MIDDLVNSYIMSPHQQVVNTVTFLIIQLRKYKTEHGRRLGERGTLSLFDWRVHSFTVSSYAMLLKRLPNQLSLSNHYIVKVELRLC